MRSLKIFKEKIQLVNVLVNNNMLKNLVKSFFCCNKPFVSHPVEKIMILVPPFLFCTYICMFGIMYACVRLLSGVCVYCSPPCLLKYSIYWMLSSTTDSSVFQWVLGVCFFPHSVRGMYHHAQLLHRCWSSSFRYFEHPHSSGFPSS